MPEEDEGAPQAKLEQHVDTLVIVGALSVDGVEDVELAVARHAIFVVECVAMETEHRRDQRRRARGEEDENENYNANVAPPSASVT